MFQIYNYCITPWNLKNILSFLISSSNFQLFKLVKFLYMTECSKFLAFKSNIRFDQRSCGSFFIIIKHLTPYQSITISINPSIYKTILTIIIIIITTSTYRTSHTGFQFINYAISTPFAVFYVCVMCVRVFLFYSPYYTPTLLAPPYVCIRYQYSSWL